MNVRLALAAVACGLLCLGPSGAADQTPLEIGVIVSLTGPAAFTGQSDRNALTATEMVANRDGGVGGRPIHFTFSDDQSNAQLAVQLANQLIAKNPPVIIGPGFTATCRAVAPLLAKGPVGYCLSPGIDPAKDSYVFSAGPSVHEFATIIYRYARLRGWKRWSVIYTTDATGQTAEAATNDLLKSPEFKDVTLVAAEHLNSSDLEVSAQIARIKAANPQMIVAWPSGTGFGTVLHGIAQGGLDVPVLGTSANLNYEQLKGYAAFLPRELYFEGSPFVANAVANRAMERQQATFFAAMKAVGQPPDAQSGIVYDVGHLIVDALRKAGPNADAEHVRRYIAGLTNYSGSAGVYDFRSTPQRGLTVKDLVMMRYDPVKPAFLQVSKLGGEPLR